MFLISSSIILLSGFAIVFNINNLTNFICLLCFANLYLIYGSINPFKKNKLLDYYLATIIYNIILILYYKHESTKL